MKLWVLFMKTGFFTRELQQCLRSVSHRPISQANKREQQTQQRWLEILAGKDLQTKVRKSEDVDFKFSTSNNTAKANTVNQRQRLQSDHEFVNSQQQNTTVTLQTKPTKRGNTDCRRFSKIRSIEFARRGKFTVKIIFFDATIGSKNYTICKIDTRSIFPTD